MINTLLPHPVYPTVFASGSEDGLVGEDISSDIDLHVRSLEETKMMRW